MKHILLALIPAFVASLALFGARFIPTHDGEYHVIRLWQFYTMLQHGYLFPQWAPNLNSGYGLPLFLFHYPLPNYVGALIHMSGVSFVDSIKYVLALGYMTAMFWYFLWVYKLFGRFAAVIGTIVCSYVPYWFVDIYVRGSVGEIWAMAFVFLTLAAVVHGWRPIISLGIAGIILSHNITAFIMIPPLCVYSWIRSRGYLWNCLIGVGLSAYFWIPALVESHYMSGLNSVSFRDHFPELYQLLIPSWGTGFSGPGLSADEMSYQIGVIPVVLFFLAAYTWVRRKNTRALLLPVIVLGACTIFTLTPYSLVVWENIPYMSMIQYPWRLLLVLIIASGYLAAALTTLYPRWFMISVSIIAIVSSIAYTKPVTYEARNDLHYLSKREFTDGTSSMGNSFTTIWTSWKSNRFENRFELATDATSSVIAMHDQNPLSYTLTVSSKSPTTLVAHILYFPGWKASVDGKQVPISFETDGIIHISIPEGTHQVHVEFGQTATRFFSGIVTVVSLFSLLGWAILKVTYANRH